MKKVVITYGLISGGILGLCMVLSIPMYKNMDLDKSMFVGYATMVLAFSMIYFAIARYRKLNGGEITYKKGLLIGLQIAVISSIIYSLVWMVISYTVFPNFMEAYAEASMKQLEASGASAAVKQQKLAEMKPYMEYYKNPFLRFIFTFMEPIFPGLLISFITPLFVRSKKQKNIIA